MFGEDQEFGFEHAGAYHTSMWKAKREQKRAEKLEAALAMAQLVAASSPYTKRLQVQFLVRAHT